MEGRRVTSLRGGGIARCSSRRRSYFGVVFGAGFVLGPIRVLWLVPRVGSRIAELLETPLILAAILIAAYWMNRRFPAAPRERLRTGFVALGLVLVADVAVGVSLRGMTVSEVFTNRDPVSGTVYYALLAVFSVAPWWMARREPIRY